MRSAPALAFSILAACGGKTDPLEDPFMDRCAPYESALAESSRAVIGGRETSGDRAIVAVGDRPVFDCTGIVIDPQAVLTAAHCSQYLPDQIGIGDDVEAMEVVKVARAITFEGYGVPSMPATHDVGILLLERPVLETPIKVRREAITDALLGAELRVVGFGADFLPEGGDREDATGFGKKREGHMLLSRIQPEQVLLAPSANGERTCYGDSGGPALLRNKENGEEEIFAITSTAEELDRSAGIYYARIDRALDFIDENVALAGHSAIVPHLQCVSEEADGSFIAHFGYTNNNLVPVQIPEGASNQLCGLGPIEVFMPRAHDRAFTIRFDARETLIWRLASPEGTQHEVRADAYDVRCL